MSTPAPGASRLRLVISEAGAQRRLTSLLALQRIEEPDVELSLSETTPGQQVEGLLTGLYDVGLAISCEENNGLTAEPIWQEPLALAVPARSPLLTYTRVPLPEALRYPMVLWHPTACAGIHRQVGRILDRVAETPIVAERVASSALMMTLVAAGYGIGLAPTAQIVAYRPLGVVMRPLAGLSPQLITYLLRPQAEARDSLSRFAKRAMRAGSMHLGNMDVATSPCQR
ncbi:LysR family substrate-binding domain-containing protein [Parazoarcus communis]|uniref:LysR family substrate-binding domain-containing protein n=1 Tax=Parazoarcus communis TaxID=41977 RepID=UPI002006E626|nr:LysR family substrate-binding domain-containing protein [Parazoarcus communis]